MIQSFRASKQDIPQCMDYKTGDSVSHVGIFDPTLRTIAPLTFSLVHLPTSPPSQSHFMYRRPTLCTLHIAVDFLKSMKIAVVWGGGVLLGYSAYIISL